MRDGAREALLEPIANPPIGSNVSNINPSAESFHDMFTEKVLSPSIQEQHGFSQAMI